MNSKEQLSKIIEHNYTYNISEESEQTRQFAGDTVFWVLKK